MALVKTTILTTDVSEEFAPGGEFYLQVESAAPASELPGLVIDVDAAVDAVAGLSALYSWRLTDGAIKRFAPQARVRVKIRGNIAGNTVTIRRSE